MAISSCQYISLYSELARDTQNWPSLHQQEVDFYRHNLPESDWSLMLIIYEGY